MEFTAPFYPIVYVRGYAGSDDEVEDTVADPYMGFNLGATKIRQRWTGTIERHYFESPLVRLMKSTDTETYTTPVREMAAGRPVYPRSIFIYRYYDRVSDQLGLGKRDEIEDYARGLSELISIIRTRICSDNDLPPEIFRVHSVAHSMGGLICRSFLQNPETDPHASQETVDRVFTYATPHNGIDLEIIGNVPGFFTRNNADNFNRERMKEYLKLPKKSERVDSLQDSFDPERFFTLVGTNYRDYAVAGGWARRVVGPSSDGLVRMQNATVSGVRPDGSRHHSPRGYVHRSHSGHFGIVNSEEGYQNLTRFLFGDVRVDGALDVRDITLPTRVEAARKKGKQIRASYHFDTVVRVRRARWDLHRRLTDEESAIFRGYDEMFPEDGKRRRNPYLFSVFLARWATKPRGRSLGFSVDLGVQVPEYEVDGALWLDEHYEGGYLYRDKINFLLTPVATDGGWLLSYGLDSATPNRTKSRLDPVFVDHGSKRAGLFFSGGDMCFEVPVTQRSRPGLIAQLVLRVRSANRTQ